MKMTLPLTSPFFRRKRMAAIGALALAWGCALGWGFATLELEALGISSSLRVGPYIDMEATPSGLRATFGETRCRDAVS